MVVSRVMVVLIFLPCCLLGQTNRYFVSFKDKANSSYSISNPLQFLSQKSLDRRTREDFVLSQEDLPVNQSYVQQVKATGAETYFTSRWMNGLLIQTSPTIASSISNLPFVTQVELVGWGSRLMGRTKTKQKMEAVNTPTSLLNQQQLKMIGLDQMQADGFYGEGVDVAVFDAGFVGVDTQAAFQSIYQEGRLKAAFSFVTNSTDIYSEHPHGAWVMSIMAGNIPTWYLGGAPKANFFLYQTEDAYSEFRIEEYNWLFAAEKADSAGIDVINSSLGYFQFDDPSMDYTYQNMDGKTSVVARAARKAFERGIVLVNSAGNEGNKNWKYIITPADAEGVISCGAVDSVGKRVSFSSIGPASDGRVKPDVSAMGGLTAVIDIDGYVKLGSGTSFSSPLVACLATGLRQALPKASAAEIYSRIINSASLANNPDDFLGYGIPDYKRAVELTDFKDEFEVYPNPTRDQLKIIFKAPEGENVFVMLFSSTGQKVLEKTMPVNWNDNPVAIDMSMYTSGVYYLRVQSAASVRTVRLVKTN